MVLQDMEQTIEATVSELSPSLQRKIGKPLTTKVKVVFEEEDEKDEAISKWESYAQKVDETPPLSGVGGYIMECSREFRESSDFEHDHP